MASEHRTDNIITDQPLYGLGLYNSMTVCGWTLLMLFGFQSTCVQLLLSFDGFCSSFATHVVRPIPAALTDSSCFTWCLCPRDFCTFHID